jgi:SH3-like domain-containing protein
METKSGFTKMTVDEFKTWIKDIRIARTILRIQQHHTYLPNCSHFAGNNHFDRQQAMKNHHMVNNGWSDIGQHFTIFPDGFILTGRNLEMTPACIYGQNSNSICIENFGNFDLNCDVMTIEQRDAIVTVTSALLAKFNLPADIHSVIYHHWFDLSTGQRTHSNRNKKSCPGSNFFGGNKESDCISNFLPLLHTALTGGTTTPNPVPVLRFAFVTASLLNIRIAPTSSSSKAFDRDPVTFGTVLRVYEEDSGWLKISSSQSHWISSRFTLPVTKAIVTANSLNIRMGPGSDYAKTGSIGKDEVVFVFEESNGWARISINEQWVSQRYLSPG